MPLPRDRNTTVSAPVTSSKKSIIEMFLIYRYLIYHTSERQAGDFHMPS